MAEEAMLDVSMIAHPGSLRKLVALASIKPDALSGLRVSATFIERVSSDKDNPDLVRQIGRYFSVPPRLIDLNRIREFIESSPFREFVQPYRPEGGPRTQEYRRRLLEDVRENDAWAYEIVVEEWEFLTTHSWLFGKTRAIYDRMINAGANALYVTKENLEQAIDAVGDGIQHFGHGILRGSDRVVRRTLKKGPHYEVSPNDRVRTVAKWVAVGGGAATALINPVAGVLGASAGGMFLLYDP
jgi:hypothetical protein